MIPTRTIVRALGGCLLVAGAVWLYFDEPSVATTRLVGESAKSRAAHRARRVAPASGLPAAPQADTAVAATSTAAGVADSTGLASAAGAPADSSRAGSVQSPLSVIRDEGLVEDVVDGNVVVPGKISRYARHLLGQYDTDRDGRLQENEWANMRGNPRLADRDRNGELTEDELAARVTAYGVRRTLRLMPVRTARAAATNRSGLSTGSPPVGVLVEAGPMPGQGETLADADSRAAEARRRRRYHVPTEQLPQGLADWFVDNDADGDGQITMTEFSANLSEIEVERFFGYDLNADGVITPQEFIGSELTRRAAEEAAKQQQLAAEQAVDAAEAAQQAAQAAAPPPRGQ